MDLTMVDLGLLADPLRCSEMEPAAIKTARFFLDLPAQLDRHRPAEQILARAEFIRAVAEHWPAGPTRPPEVTLLLERFGDPRASNV
jgi:hypothetical protein